MCFLRDEFSRFDMPTGSSCSVWECEWGCLVKWTVSSFQVEYNGLHPETPGRNDAVIAQATWSLFGR